MYLLSFPRFPDSGLYLLNGFDLYFDLFYVAWHWKPAIHFILSFIIYVICCCCCCCCCCFCSVHNCNVLIVWKSGNNAKNLRSVTLKLFDVPFAQGVPCFVRQSVYVYPPVFCCCCLICIYRSHTIPEGLPTPREADNLSSNSFVGLLHT